MSERIYNADQDSEYWHCQGYEEAAQDYVDSGNGVPENGLITIHSGIKENYTAKDLFSIDVVEEIDNYIFDDFGDYAESWISELNKKTKEIAEVMADSFNKFCTENDLQPPFFRFKYIEPVTVKIVVKNGIVESAILVDQLSNTEIKEP